MGLMERNNYGYNDLIAFSFESDNADTIKLGGTQVPELKNNNIYILWHSDLDPNSVMEQRYWGKLW